jgi:hypothetical protein
LIIIGILLGFSILILALPIYFDACGEFEPQRKVAAVRASFILKILQIRLVYETNSLRIFVRMPGWWLPILRHSTAKESVKKEVKKKPTKPKKERRRKSRMPLTGWFGFARELLPRVFRPMRFRGVHGDLTVGFANPAITGIFFSVYYLSRFTLDFLRDVNIKPDFKHAGLVGNFELGASIHLIRYFPILIFAYKNYRRWIRKVKEK